MRLEFQESCNSGDLQNAASPVWSFFGPNAQVSTAARSTLILRSGSPPIYALVRLRGFLNFFPKGEGQQETWNYEHHSVQDIHAHLPFGRTGSGRIQKLVYNTKASATQCTADLCHKVQGRLQHSLLFGAAGLANDCHQDCRTHEW